MYGETFYRRNTALNPNQNEENSMPVWIDCLPFLHIITYTMYMFFTTCFIFLYFSSSSYIQLSSFTRVFREGQHLFIYFNLLLPGAV